MSMQQRKWVWLPVMMFAVMILYLISSGFAVHTAQAGILADPPVLTLAPAADTKTVGESETMTAQLTNVISPTGTVITFTVSGPNAQIGTATADATGMATFTYTGNNAGTDTIVASATVLTVSLTSNTATITWNKAPTALAYDGATTGDFHDPAAVSATLIRSDTNAPVSGAAVSFSLNGTDTCTGTTDGAGKAGCTITPTLPAGTYTLTASFAGDAILLASDVSVPFTVTREQTTLTYTGPTLIANGQSVTLSGVLKEDGTTPIAGRTVAFTLGSGGGAQSCTGVTDATGVASCTINPVNQPLGEAGTVSASFAGDDFYLPSSASMATLIFAFLDKGSFVVGDKSATGKVTFWSSQWAKANTLSGGKAPSSFKGFADFLSSTPPSCGGTWSARPGNSPPHVKGPLPSYMGVVVASSVGKSGPKISGNIASIVVVKIDPGFAPNPGHRGTGTVVAVFCQ